MSLPSDSRRGFLKTAFAGAAALGGETALADEKKQARDKPVKITGVKTFLLKHKLPKAIGPSTAMYDERDALLIKISSDAGLDGWGETANLDGVRTLIEAQGKSLVGKNPLEHRKIWRGLWGPNFGNGLAVGGLDIALQDLRGKILGVPVADLFGGRLRDRVPVYASSMNYTEGKEPEKQYPEEAAALVQRGFKAMKMRIGGLPRKRDIAAATAVREAVGPDIKLMVDGNGAYSLASAVRVGRELEKLDYYFYEEPLPQMDYAGYEVLTAQLDIPIAAGEVLDSRGRARELILRRAMRIIQPDVTLCGGIGEVLFIAEMARLWGIPCIPHCWGGAIAIAASLQLLSLLPDTSWARTTETPYLEMDVYENPFRDHLTAKPPAIAPDGLIDVPTGPGLGIEVDESAFKRYTK